MQERKRRGRSVCGGVWKEMEGVVVREGGVDWGKNKKKKRWRAGGQAGQ